MKKTFFFFIIFLLVASIVNAGEKKQDSENKESMKPVLLVIDIQNAYLPYMSDEDNKMALEIINGAIGLFRQHDFPVIRVYHQSLEWGPETDSHEFQFPENIQVNTDDPMIIKHFPSAFQKTTLETMIRDKGCNTVYICGLSAVGCVLATYYGAIERDFQTFMIKGALLSHNASYTDAVEDFTDAVGWSSLKTMLEMCPKDKGMQH